MALNLVQHRSGPSVWERADDRAEWDTERWLIAIAAGAFAVSGIRRRSRTGLMLVLGGAALGWWAASGADLRQKRRGRLMAVLPSRAVPADMIREASEESFPASDAPSWTPTTANTGPVPPARTRPN